MSPFYTHQPYLRTELDKLSGKLNVKIIEFGVGDGSSIIFNEYAKANPTWKIKAYESDHEWYQQMKEKYELPNYIFQFGDWDTILNVKKFPNKYDLVFVDQSPWEARIASMRLMKKKSTTIILHDYDFFNKGVCGDIYSCGEESAFSEFLDKFVLTGNRNTLPPTLVMNSK